MAVSVTAPHLGVTLLNAAEILFVAQHRELVSGLCGGAVEADALSGLYDRVLVTWAASPAADRADSAQLVNAFGIALGDLVVERVSGLRWVSATDAVGTELALQHPDHEILVYPVGAVGRRWAAGETGWLATYPDEIARGLAEIFDAPPTSPSDAGADADADADAETATPSSEDDAEAAEPTDDAQPDDPSTPGVTPAEDLDPTPAEPVTEPSDDPTPAEPVNEPSDDPTPAEPVNEPHEDTAAPQSKAPTD